MLCPEVWNFEPPSCKTSYKITKNHDDAKRTARHQYFNHCVSLTLLDTIHVPPSIEHILTWDTDFYHIANVPAHEFVDFVFIKHFIKNGNLTLLSIDTKIDQDDCMAITPNGELIFSLCRKSYQELGIDGQGSMFSNKPSDRYEVVVNFNQDIMNPQTKYYQRLKAMLKANKNLCFNVVCAWEPHKSEICPSSLAAYFSNNGYKVKTCTVKLKKRQEFNVDVPLFENEDDGEIIMEWLGAFNIGCHIPTEADRFISTYERPHDHVQFGQVVCLQAYGFFTCDRITKLMDEVKKYSDTLSDLAWIGLTVNGFEDSVMNFAPKEHSFYTSGDYNHTVIYQNKLPYLTCVHVDTTRKPKRTTKIKRRKNCNKNINNYI